MKEATKRLLATGLLQEFVRDCQGSWSPGDWLGLMLKLNWEGFNKLPEADVRRLVADNSEWWLEGNDTLSPKRGTDARSSGRGRKKNPRQLRRPR